MNHCPCVFPAPSEEEWVTLPGSDANTALRMYVQAGADGYVRLQQLSYDPGAGWYVQKTFIVPAEMLSTLATHFRKADCLMARPSGGAGHSLKLVPGVGSGTVAGMELRRA